MFQHYQHGSTTPEWLRLSRELESACDFAATPPPVVTVTPHVHLYVPAGASGDFVCVTCGEWEAA
jgi:hypothetical protein